MRAWRIMVVSLLLASGTAQADTQSLDQAREAAASGDYTQAVKRYQQALDRNGFSAPVLFNLGNAWLRLGKPGPAILNFERALVLAPGSPGIEANLATAQQRAGVTPVAVGSWQSAARHFSFDTYAWAGLIAVWVLCTGLVLLCLNRPVRRIARPLILVAAVVLCVSADAAALCWSDPYRAVIVQGPATLHVAPADGAGASGTLREGEVVWLQEHYAGFNFVRTADGHSGWVSETVAVAVRAPRP